MRSMCSAKSFALIALATLALQLFGCATRDVPPPPNSITKEKAAATRFLGADYVKMAPVPNSPDMLAWRKPGVNPKQYTRILLSPTVLWREQTLVNQSGIALDELVATAKYFDVVLNRALAAVNFPIATAPGPHTMRIEAAITSVKASQPTMNTITSVTPFGIIMTLGRKASGSADPSVGACTVEMRFSDAETGEILAIYADHKDGDKYDSANFTELGQAEKAMDEWAEMLRVGILKRWGARAN